MSVCRTVVPALALIGTLLLIERPGTAMAQESKSNEKAGDIGLPTILVTASKEEKRLQDVPISISAISEADLARRGAVDLNDVAASIPNVSFSFGNGEGRTLSRTISLRGIYGPDTTGLYIDETPVDQSVPIKLVDVNRIELLRGPQGTLYGARSMGGTVRVISNQPDLRNYGAQLSGEVSSTEHGSDNYSAEVTFNAPIVENALGVRGTVYRDYWSGIFDRYYGPEGDSDPTDSPKSVDRGTDPVTLSGARLSLRWVPTDWLTLTPRVIYQVIDNRGASLADTTPNNFAQIRPFDLPEPLTDRLTLSTLELAANFGWGSFFSSTSYFTRFNKQTEDYTQFTASPQAFDLPIPYPTTATVQDDEDRITEEARFVTAFMNRFKFIMGVFYQETTLDSNFYSTSPGFDQFVHEQLGIPLFGTDNLFSSVATRKTRDKAVFGELTVDLTHRLAATIGLRWFDTFNSVDRYADGIFNGGPSHDVGQQKENGVNPKYSLAYKLSDDALVYATAARGFRSGGVNTHIPEDLCGAALAALGLTVEDVASYKSDHLWNYEVGGKTSWLDHRLTLNGAVFYIDWTDLIQGVRLPCGFGYTGNVGAARSQGFEFEAMARPTPNLNLTFGAGYTDATITNVGNTSGGAAVDAQVGDRIQQVPRWNIFGSAQYYFPVPNGHRGFVRADGLYVTKSFTTFDESDVLHTRNPYAIFNLQTGITGGDWEVALFARNLFNRHANYSDTQSIAAELEGRPRLSTNRPRTIGISASKGFWMH
jgi:iron complex outermembrane recepter protein